MTDKLLKSSDRLILFALISVVTLAFLFPVFSHPYMGIFYKILIVSTGFIYVLSRKLLKEENKIETPLDGFLFLLFILYIISTAGAEHFVVSFNSCVDFFVLLLFFYICYDFSRGHHTLLTAALISVASLLSIYAVYQYFFGFEETLAYLKKNRVENFGDIKFRLESMRVFATMIYPNALAGLLILTIPVGIGFFKTQKKSRPLTLFALILMSAALFLTKSYGAFISLIIATAIMGVISFRSSLKNFRLISVFSAAAASLLFGAALYLRGTEDLISGFLSKTESFADMLKLSALYVFKGAGPGSFEMIYNSPAGEGHYLKYAYNVIFQVAIELGLPALITILAAVFFTYRAIARNFYFLRTPESKIYVISLLTGLTAFLIHNLVDFDIYNFELSIAFLLVLAILMSQVKIGLLQLRKIKLTYMLGTSPGKRRAIILYIIAAIAVLSAVTGGKHIVPYTAMLFLVISGFALWSVSKEDIRRTSVDIPLLLLAFWYIISLVHSPDIYTGAKYFSLFLVAAVIFYLVSQFLRRHDFKIILSNIIIITGISFAFIGIGQFIYRVFTGGPFYADGFFPNQSFFALYLVIPFSLLFSRFLFEKKIRYLSLKISGLIILASAVSLASSKSGVVSLLVVFILTWIYYNRNLPRIKDTAARSKFKTVVLRFLLALIIILSFTGLTPSGKKITKVKSDPYYFNRVKIYKASLSMTMDAPFFGHGLGSFKTAFPPYNFPVKGVSKYGHEPAFAHNEFLHAAAETGIPGLALLVLFIIALMKNIPSYSGHRKLWSAETGAYFAAAAILAHSFFYFTLHVPGILFTFAVLSGIFIKEKYNIPTIPKKSLFFIKIYYFPALILSFILFSAALRYPAGHYLYSEYKSGGPLKLVEQAEKIDPLNPEYSFKKGLYFEKAGMPERALKNFENSLKLNRLDYITMLHAARVNARFDRVKEAVRYYNSAVAANPYRAFTYTETGAYYLRRFSDTKSAFSYFKKALDVEPNFAQARLNLASLYMKTGQYEKALSQLTLAEKSATQLKPATEYDKNLLDAPPEVIYRKKADVLLALGEDKEGCKYYKKTFKITGSREIKDILPSVCKKVKAE